jgi:hypothetical protein
MQMVLSFCYGLNFALGHACQMAWACWGGHLGIGGVTMDYTIRHFLCTGARKCISVERHGRVIGRYEQWNVMGALEWIGITTIPDDVLAQVFALAHSKDTVWN